MKSINNRLLQIVLPPKKSAFLWGPRKTGKTYWLKQTFPEAVYIDLLQTDVFGEYASRPALLRERYSQPGPIVIIDEIQSIPLLLNEVHWLIENSDRSFILSGSSPRKLRNKGMNLLGGRAWRYTLQPLSFMETKGFDLEQAMRSGLLPPHFLSPDPVQDLRAYVGDYLREEIAAEARIQNIPSFAEFLRVAAITSSELLNYTNVARESGITARMVRQYFQILEDTLVGFRLPPWRKSRQRRMIETEKFYLFDIGVCNYLSRRAPALGTPEFGKSFEHFILTEICAYRAYKNPELPLYYWRTSTGMEVDFILGDMTAAVEVKGTARAHEGHLRTLRALLDEHTPRHAILVSLDKEERIIDKNIRIMPWEKFLEELWGGEIV